MGNQVTTLGQIYPVEYYLADYGTDLVLDASLGSTRFMKVARVRHREAGYCVAKIYAIHDATLPINEHRAKIEHIRDTLKQNEELNALPFVRCYINEKSVILLRQYIKYNLYDRLSTRPFLTSIEKRWIAYQLLRCVQSLHKRNIFHGDIKSENVLISSFLWVSITDFASYKPVTLPENNPSDFSYFFDTSRRQCCNMAPERFVGTAPNEANYQQYSEATDQTDSYNQLTPQMDLFSLGCVLAELFLEDNANSSLFDLGQILMFKKNQYEPSKIIENGISDSRIARLILNLTDLDCMKRNSASYHLDQSTPSLFPAYFNTLYKYFTKLITQSPDTKILSLTEDIDALLTEIITEDEHGLLLPLVLVTSTLRSLRLTHAKLTALKLCVRLVESSPHIMSEYVIDRVLPYFIYMISSTDAQVRSTAISSLNILLKHVDHLLPSDANVFIDYILPSLCPLVYDKSVLVRISLASNVADLAETSQRFMDLPCEKNFDLELTLLQESFQMIVTHLLTDPNNNVRRTILTSNISKLCLFFGREKTNEVILSHIITFLNDKSDFRLRAAFFDNINCVSTYLGPYFAAILKPIMQQGLSDSEESIIYKCLTAVSSMTQLGLLSKSVVYELHQEAVPLLSFPNKWIRNAAINFVVVLAKVASTIDFNRKILPAIKLHIKRDIHGLKDESVLLDSLQEPLPRPIIDSIICDNGDIENIFHSISKKKMSRNSQRFSGGKQMSEDEEILAGLSRHCEDRLIDSELILRRIHKNKRGAVTKTMEPTINIPKQDAQIQNMSKVEQRMSATLSLSKSTKPRGVLLAHLHEHKGTINKLMPIPGTSIFASASNDATIKFWDCTGLGTKPNVLFRSKQTYTAPDAGAIKKIACCRGSDTLIALTDSNNLHFLKLYTPSLKSRLLSSTNGGDETMIDLVAISQFTYACSLTNSRITGHDLRSSSSMPAWSIKMAGSEGLITCIDGDEYCLACGTSSSVIALFDLRFLVKATSMSYPPFQDRIRKRVRNIVLCNDEIFCSVDGNNEVSTWHCESGTRTRTLWASAAPCLSSTQSSHHSVLNLIVDTNVDTNSVITAGTDMKIRFWDLVNPHRSYIISGPSVDLKQNQTKGNQTLNLGHPNVVYSQKLIEGIQVIQESDRSIVRNHGGSQMSPASESCTGDSLPGSSINNGQYLPNQPEVSTSHHDSISDIAILGSSSLLISASRDGVIKIWR